MHTNRLLCSALTGILCSGCEEKKVSSIPRHQEPAPLQAPQPSSINPTSPTATVPGEVSGDPRINAANEVGKIPAATLSQRAFAGDGQAGHDLVIIAKDKAADKIERGVAFQYLALSKKPKLLAIIAEQLNSDDHSIRVSAYFSLPEKLQIKHFDYTASPSERSSEEIRKLIERILEWDGH